jgi:ABC-type multidrug transport system ATPase subunit
MSQQASKYLVAYSTKRFYLGQRRLPQSLRGGDVDIQAQFHRAIFETFAESTVVCITHQIDTIRHFDVAIVLDRGKIVEQGNPRILLNEEGSKLKQLSSLQKAEAVMVEKGPGV